MKRQKKKHFQELIHELIGFAVLQIRRGKRHRWISLRLFSKFFFTKTCCDPTKEPPHWDGSYEGSQHGVSSKKMKHYLGIILHSQPYLIIFPQKNFH